MATQQQSTFKYSTPYGGTNYNSNQPLGEFTLNLAGTLSNLSANTGSDWNLYMAIGKAVGGTIKGFFDVKSQQQNLKMQSSSLKFQSELSKLNARSYEKASQKVLQVGESKTTLYGLQAQQFISSYNNAYGARGIKGGEGSAGEIEKSMDFSVKSDIFNMSIESLENSFQYRNAMVQELNNADILKTKADILDRSAGNSLTPWLGALNASLQQAPSVFGAAGSFFGAGSSGN